MTNPKVKARLSAFYGLEQDKPAKRYTWLDWKDGAYNATVRYSVYDNWTNTVMGRYATKSQAQARARLLNSRNGGK